MRISVRTALRVVQMAMVAIFVHAVVVMKALSVNTVSNTNIKENTNYLYLLLSKLIIAAQACNSVPCLNSASCNSDGIGGYICTCSSDYEGTNCEYRIF